MVSTTHTTHTHTHNKFAMKSFFPMENGSDRIAQVLFSFQINTFTLTSETPALLTADDAVLVLQASHGQVDRMSSLGDPTLVFPPPTDQWSQAYYFAVPDLAGDQRKK